MTPGLIGALTLALTVAALATRLASFLNRHLLRVEAHGKRLVRERLSRRELLPTTQFVNELGISEEARPAATAALERLANAIGVDVGALRPTDVLQDILRVRPSQLPANLQIEWTKAKLGESLDVCVYDVMHVLEKTADRPAWSRASLRVPQDKRPRSEEGWVDYILPLTLGEIVRLFFG